MSTTARSGTPAAGIGHEILIVALGEIPRRVFAEYADQRLERRARPALGQHLTRERAQAASQYLGPGEASARSHRLEQGPIVSIDVDLNRLANTTFL